MEIKMDKIKPGYMSIEDTAQYLSVHKDTIRRLINSRQLAAYRIRSKIIIRIDDLEQYLKSNKIVPFNEQIKKIKKK
ncbi:MAG: helix-turn-helix domain-containing protein [bacterium]